MRDDWRLMIKIFLRRAQRQEWKKKRNFSINRLKKKDRLILNLNTNFKFKPIPKEYNVKVPKKFSFKINLNEVVTFISKCKSPEIIKHARLYFDFAEVESLDIGALTLLLSLVKDLGSMNIYCRGNMPINEKAKKTFIDSGYLEYFVNDKQRRFRSSKNKILYSNSAKINPPEAGEIIKRCSTTVWGEERKIKKLYSTLIEMMSNAINHAFIDSNQNTNASFIDQLINIKPWLLSIDYDIENRKVNFMFIDNGVGIFESINVKTLDSVLHRNSPEKILQKAFDGQYGSSTNEEIRGQGLKTIKDCVVSGVIKNLNVLTSDCLFNFATNSANKLEHKFAGTCYFWELDNECRNELN